MKYNLSEIDGKRAIEVRSEQVEWGERFWKPNPSILGQAADAGSEAILVRFPRVGIN